MHCQVCVFRNELFFYIQEKMFSCFGFRGCLFKCNFYFILFLFFAEILYLRNITYVFQLMKNSRISPTIIYCWWYVNMVALSKFIISILKLLSNSINVFSFKCWIRSQEGEVGYLLSLTSSVPLISPYVWSGARA